MPPVFKPPHARQFFLRHIKGKYKYMAIISRRRRRAAVQPGIDAPFARVLHVRALTKAWLKDVQKRHAEVHATIAPEHGNAVTGTPFMDGCCTFDMTPAFATTSNRRARGRHQTPHALSTPAPHVLREHAAVVPTCSFCGDAATEVREMTHHALLPTGMSIRCGACVPTDDDSIS